MWFDLPSFYKSREWSDFRQVLILERTQADGYVHDELTGLPIVKPYDIILHHKEELTLDNVNDAMVALNPDNIMIVSFKSHNIIHNRFGRWTRHIYLVYGCPLAGKSSWVKENAGQHDLIIDIDRIYQCISNNEAYQKSGRIADNVFLVRDLLLDMVRDKKGKWVNAFIVGGYPYSGERERLCVELGAEQIYIDCDKETALLRLATCTDGREKIADYSKYIEQWFDRYSA